MPQWIDRSTRLGPKRMVPWDEARVFPTEADAESEIRGFAILLPDGVRFELEDEYKRTMRGLAIRAIHQHNAGDTTWLHFV